MQLAFYVSWVAITFTFTFCEINVKGKSGSAGCFWISFCNSQLKAYTFFKCTMKLLGNKQCEALNEDG